MREWLGSSCDLDLVLYALRLGSSWAVCVECKICEAEKLTYEGPFCKSKPNNFPFSCDVFRSLLQSCGSLVIKWFREINVGIHMRSWAFWAMTWKVGIFAWPWRWEHVYGMAVSLVRLRRRAMVGNIYDFVHGWDSESGLNTWDFWLTWGCDIIHEGWDAYPWETWWLRLQLGSMWSLPVYI